MNQPCKGNTAQLLRLMDGSLRSGATDEARTHLEGCPGCKETFERLQRIHQLCENIGQEPPPKVAWRQIEAQIHWKMAQQTSVTNKKVSRLRWMPALGALTGAVALGAVLGIFLFHQPAVEDPSPTLNTSTKTAPLAALGEEIGAVVTLTQGEVSVISTRGKERPLEISRPLIQGDRVITGSGQVAFQWGQDSGVLLEDDTEVVIKQLRSNQQEFRLWQGQLLAQVQKLKPDHGFSVVANGIRASVRGTLFSMEANSKFVEVNVYEGIVEVSAEDGSWPAEMVHAGRHLRIQNNTPAYSQQSDKPEDPGSSRMNLQPWASFQRVMAGSGLLSVASSPPGADITLDNAKLGKTDLILRSSLGRHQVALWRNGKLLKKQWVDVELKQNTWTMDVQAETSNSPRRPRLPPSFKEVFDLRAIQIQGCYERRLKLNPALKGKITLRILVNSSGSVEQASLEVDTLGDPGVGQCALGAIRRWKFPPGNEAEVVFPFVFKSQ